MNNRIMDQRQGVNLMFDRLIPFFELLSFLHGQTHSPIQDHVSL